MVTFGGSQREHICERFKIKMDGDGGNDIFTRASTCYSSSSVASQIPRGLTHPFGVGPPAALNLSEVLALTHQFAKDDCALAKAAGTNLDLILGGQGFGEDEMRGWEGNGYVTPTMCLCL